MSTILAAISVVLTLAGFGVQEYNASKGNKIRDRITQVANKIYSKIGNNNTLLNKLYEAYSTKNAELGNSILMSAGFGPMITELRKAQKKNTDDYHEKKEKIDKENIELNNKYNQATNASAQAGYTFAGNRGAENIANQLEQYVEGGLNSETQVQQS